MIGISISAGIGLIVGSFLNVVIMRLHTGQSTSGRSGCMSCGEQLKWYDLFPVISFTVLRGKCRDCGSTISHQYWIVELSTSILFALVYMIQSTILITGLLFVLMALLVVITVYDIRHTIIPNEMVYLFISTVFLIQLVSILSVNTTFIQFVQYSIEIFLSGIMVAIPLFLLWFVSRGAWMGFGDVKLSFGIGVLLGVYGGFTALFIGFLFGAVIGLVLLYGMPVVMKWLSLNNNHNHLTMKSEVPFAPFLISGLLLVLFFQVDVISLLGHLV